MIRLSIPLLLLHGVLLAQSPDSTGLPADSAAASVGETPAPPDSAYRMSTPTLVGTLDRWLGRSAIIARREIPWLHQRYLGDILENFPGVFIADQQSEGQYSRAAVRGADWRSIAILADGRLMNDPATGITNLYALPTEYADRIEVISGPRAFVYGLNSTGGAVNFVTKNYNSNRPFSSLAYSEGGYNASRTDGLFSQNISRRVNVTAGFQAQSTDGRFINAGHEQWNARVKLRYNPFRDLNIILSHGYIHTQTGLHGGVDLLRSGTAGAFDPLLAVMVNTDAYEKQSRHDIDLSLVGTILDDSASTSTLTFFFSHQLREYRDEENRFPSNGTLIQSDHTSSWMGVSVKQVLTAGGQRLQTGGTVELRQIEGSPNMGRRRNVLGSVWAVAEFLPTDDLVIGGFGRLDRFLHSSRAGLGADIRLSLAAGFTVFGGGSFSHRLPTYQELFWSGASVTRVDPVVPERHRVGEAGIEFRQDSSSTVRIALFHRTVEEPIRIVPQGGASVFPGFAFINGQAITTNGVDAGISWRVWVLALEGRATYLLQKNRDGSRIRDLPRFSGSSGIYFRNTILSGNLDLKVGFLGRYLGASAGELFHPEALAYVPNTVYDAGQGSSLDFQLFAGIGNAYIHFLWSNLTNAKYFTTPFYPVRDREIRFGVTWQFLD